MGGSIGVILPRALREKLGFKQGDYMAIVVVGEMLIMRRVDRSMVLDRDEIPLAALPPGQMARNNGA